MKKFDVFQLSDGSYRAIKYGFNWPSFFFTWIWCFFFARLYGWGGVWLGVLFFSGVIDKTLDEPITSSSSLPIVIALINFAAVVGFGVWFAFNANEFRRRKYAQMGYQLVRKLVGAPNRDQAISIARQDNKGGGGSRGQQKTSLAENFLKPTEKTALPKGPTSSAGSQTVFPTKEFHSSASASSHEATETRRLKRDLEEWAELSDTKLAVILATNNQQVNKKVMERLENSAGLGKSQACFLIGEIFRVGIEHQYPKNKSRARFWFKKAQEMKHPDAVEALKKLDMQGGQTEEEPADVNAKNGSPPEISDATESDDGWSEEFQILNEYDPVVKECHDELEALDPLLSSQFRDEVVSDRKKATDIRDRLKAKFEKNRKALEAELEKKNNPYSSKELNEALAEARLLGQSAEEEFTRVIEVMGEDADTNKIIGQLKEKYEPVDLEERIKNISTKIATDDKLISMIEDIGADKLGINEAKRLDGIKIIMSGRNLNRRERKSLEFLFNAAKRVVRE